MVKLPGAGAAASRTSVSFSDARLPAAAHHADGDRGLAAELAFAEILGQQNTVVPDVELRGCRVAAGLHRDDVVARKGLQLRAEVLGLIAQHPQVHVDRLRTTPLVVHGNRHHVLRGPREKARGNAFAVHGQKSS